MKFHTLKIDTIHFNNVQAGVKTFELRYNDRNFQVGEYLVLRETKYSAAEIKNGKPLEFTDREIIKRIGYILQGSCHGLQDNWAILAFAQ